MAEDGPPKAAVGFRHSLRSWLFVPADRPRFLAKLPGITADAVVLDFEDGAGSDHDAARSAVANCVGNDAVVGPSTLFVRTREVGHSGFTDDVSAALGPRLAGLVLPKVASAEQVRHAAEVSAGLSGASGAGAPLPLVLIIESAAGLAALPSILAGPNLDRVAAVAFGAEDFSADLGLPPRLGVGDTDASTGMLDNARAQIAVACAAAGVPMRIDTPSLDISDAAALEREVHSALSYGFTAKFLIHPGQVEPLHRALEPSQSEVSWAHSVLSATPDGAGAVRVGGRMVDEAILRQARNLLARVGVRP